MEDFALLAIDQFFNIEFLVGVIPGNWEPSSGVLSFQSVGSIIPVLSIVSLVFFCLISLSLYATWKDNGRNSSKLILMNLLILVFLLIGIFKRADMTQVRSLEIDIQNSEIRGRNAEFVSFQFPVDNLSHILLHRDIRSENETRLLSFVTKDNKYYNILSWSPSALRNQNEFHNWVQAFGDVLNVLTITSDKDILDDPRILAELKNRNITIEKSGIEEDGKDFIKTIMIPNTVAKVEKPSFLHLTTKNFLGIFVIFVVLLIIYYIISHFLHITFGRIFAVIRKKEWEPLTLRKVFLSKRFHGITLIVGLFWYFGMMSDQVFYESNSAIIQISKDRMDYRLDNELDKRYFAEELKEEFFYDVLLWNIFSFKEYYLSFRDSAYRSQSIDLSNILMLELIEDGKIQILYRFGALDRVVAGSEDDFSPWTFVKSLYNSTKVLNLEGIDPLAIQYLTSYLKSVIGNKEPDRSIIKF
ncbi:MAG: hypothetical protein JJT78_05920 [Leptospira sp.]|nr:hypothetical protein [Leptospira sp.]